MNPIHIIESRQGPKNSETKFKVKREDFFQTFKNQSGTLWRFRIATKLNREHFFSFFCCYDGSTIFFGTKRFGSETLKTSKKS